MGLHIHIIHPSRERPLQAAETAKRWLSSAKHTKDLDYCVAIDETDPHKEDYISYLPAGVRLFINNSKTAIEAINMTVSKVFDDARSFDILLCPSDDFDTPPFHWDEALRNSLQGKSDYLVKTDDGAQPWIITLPIMDRVYYNRFGYVYHPDFRHLFCDTAMTHVGHMLGRVIELPIKFTHNHYTTGAMAKDAINIKNDKTWAQGEEVYISQLMNQFGLSDDEIVNPINRVHPTHLAWLKTKGIDFVKA